MDIVLAIVIAVAATVIAAILVGVGRWLVQEKLPWFRTREKPDAKPSVRAEDKSIASGRNIIDSTVTTGGQPTVAKESGVAIGAGQRAPTIIVQAGANVNFYQGEFAASQDPEASDAYAEGVRLQDEEKHLEAISEFERAFSAARDHRNRAALHVQIGISFLKISRLTEAEGHFRQASDALQRDNDA